MKHDTSYWDERRGKIFSRAGGWKIGEAVYLYGENLLDEDIGRFSLMQIHVLNATGKLPTRTAANWMEWAFILLSWADSRIWCNQIGALGSQAKCSPPAAVAAGIQAASSNLYAGRTIVRGAGFIQTSRQRYDAGESVESIVESEILRQRGKKEITGYARPIAKGDERVALLQKFSAELGFEVGPHAEMTVLIENYMSEKYDELMNMNACIAGFMSDQGYTPEEQYRIAAYIVASGILACYVDHENQPYGSFLPLRCDDIEYTGTAIRPLPE